MRLACRKALVSLIRHIQEVVEKWPDDEPRELTDREERIYRYSIGTVWFVVTLLIALCVPDIGVVVSVLGGMGAFFLFIFPGQ